MLDFARVAERKVRDSNREGYEFYNPKQWEIGKRIADVVGYLPLAIQSGELQVWYQPQLNYDTGEIIGAEALCRWNHAKLGWLSPGEFIPTLESADRIYELDCFVWEKVCQDLHRWNEQGYFRSVSVNLSQRDIQKNQNIAGHFYQLIQTYGLTPDQIRIEITESAYVDNPELLIRTTVKLREFGFQVEMDDFGSGNSSLHMLKEVPVDRIKLDLHFLSGAGDPERGRIIVSQVVQMVHLLGMNLIAEGVENASQANFLQSRGCSEMQGFYFYKPMSVHEFERIVGGPNTENN
jgi:EAL domain-containing protein (putative c-di-GMP-specific phosphodiesterase class I)